MKFYKNENEMMAVYKKSAQFIDRNHPLEYVTTKKIGKIRSFYNYYYAKYNEVKSKIGNYFITKREKKYYLKNGKHSHRAMKECLDYYENMYFERYPDMDKLKALLKRNGSPDYPNPYKLGQDNFYKYNEYGLMAAEVEVILNHILSDMKGMENKDTNNVESVKEIKEQVSDILQHFDKEERKKKEKREIFYQKAMQAWAIMALYGDGCDFIKNNIEEQNINVVTIETILKVNYIEINESIELIVKSFYEKGYLSQEDATACLEQRLKIEQID